MTYALTAYDGLRRNPIYNPDGTRIDYHHQMGINHNSKYVRDRPLYDKGWSNTLEDRVPVGIQNSNYHHRLADLRHREIVDMYRRQPYEHDIMSLRQMPVKYKTYTGRSRYGGQKPINERLGIRRDLLHRPPQLGFIQPQKYLHQYGIGGKGRPTSEIPNNKREPFSTRITHFPQQPNMNQRNDPLYQDKRPELQQSSYDQLPYSHPFSSKRSDSTVPTAHVRIRNEGINWEDRGLRGLGVFKKNYNIEMSDSRMIKNTENSTTISRPIISRSGYNINHGRISKRDGFFKKNKINKTDDGLLRNLTTNGLLHDRFAYRNRYK